MSSDQGVTITATYSGQSDTHFVTIQDIPATVSSILITGPTQVDEDSTAQYTATATYSDGSTANVTGSAVWSENFFVCVDQRRDPDDRAGVLGPGGNDHGHLQRQERYAQRNDPGYPGDGVIDLDHRSDAGR